MGASSESVELQLREAVLVLDAESTVVAASSGPAWERASLAPLVGRDVGDCLAPDAVVDELRAAVRDGRVVSLSARLTDDDAAGACTVTVHPTTGATVLVLHDTATLQQLVRLAGLLQRTTALANERTATVAMHAAADDIGRTLGWGPGRVHAVVGDPLDPVVAEAVAGGRTVAGRGGRRVVLPVGDAGGVTHVLSWAAEAPVQVGAALRELLDAVGRQLAIVVAREATSEELERSNAELERFAYVASHDLQEPLRKILSFTELLQELRPPTSGEEAEFQGYVLDAARRMQTLIRDLLAFSRAGRREPERLPVDLAEVVDEVRRDLSLALQEADAELVVGELGLVRGDRSQLREVLLNVIGNAVKYRHPDRAPRIVVSSSTDDDVVELRVADNGIGIAPKHRDAVFEVFRRLHPRHEHGGTGIGLAIVQRMVERGGGSVRIDDGPEGVGSTVLFHLPAAQDPT